jgi:hypothetical protein
MEPLRPGFASRRKQPRYPAALACAVRGPALEAEGAIVDISSQGASLTLPVRPPDPGVRFTIAIFPDDEHPLVLHCEPVASSPDPMGGWLVHLRFVDTPPEAASDLENVLRALHAEFVAGQASIALDRLGPVRRARFPHYPPLLLR